MITNVACDFRDTPLPQDFDFPPNAESYPAIIPPKGSVYGTTFTLTDDELIEVQKGTKFFYILGTATYLDVFDGTPIHATKFCRQIINVLGNLTRPDKEVTEMERKILALAFDGSALGRRGHAGSRQGL